jgi:hypothetical protein
MEEEERYFSRDDIRNMSDEEFRREFEKRLNEGDFDLLLEFMEEERKERYHGK